MASLKVGQLNGGWAFLLKVALILIPIQIMFQSWCVLSIKDLERLQTKCVTFISSFHGPMPNTG